ncbi:uncharacterized protein LOC114364231 isoform X2 [Ostrinia furnacalis]|uniref:uncharacterized protein LOC114364231 isoform X1 n=1 Tax=Ostrinia furnacalis TaxID=93504 RepID=UPI00103CD2DC|nr:uncharacterized protein LOC114364231 isoform X1 [Ostrinia furnacalis]XP_028176108.1 uncharacterized protein LOC114364231 isoform X2 [Ostrinia furnacalis]
MIRHITLVAIILQLTDLSLVHTAQQQLQLSDSYLPVAMQVIAHLTDQMAYEVSDDPAPTTRPMNKPAKPTVRPTVKPTPRPTVKPVTNKPYVWSWSPSSFHKTPNGWRMVYGVRLDQTTPHHKPGLYSPNAPPKANERSDSKFVLLPMENNSEYTVIQPEDRKTGEPLLSIHEEEVKPLMEPSRVDAPLLPPHFEADKISRSDILDIDEELDDDSLQYLSHDVREMIKLANDPADEKLVDVWEGVRAGPQMAQKMKLSSSNLRLLLLYDLLSREAKRQRLSDYTGFSPTVMKTLVDSSSGGARAQLRLALSKMVDRRDCEHEYANNRAKEMVDELAKDESKLSAELRYLQPLVYAY